jgi:sigma-E factor negative regulatory protein RseB
MNPFGAWRGLACVTLLVGLGAAAPVQGAADGAPPNRSQIDGARSVSEWLVRLHEASRRQAFTGTFVVSSSGGVLSSSRIWHVCDGRQQIERVESLTGTPRATVRRNDEVLTLFPESRVARLERREALGLFPQVLVAGNFEIPAHYRFELLGRGRVAGHDADVLLFRPQDALRFGYRVWSERRTGLVVQMQTLAPDGKVLEQAAFSEMRLDAPLRVEQMAVAMNMPHGYRLERSERVKTTAASQGWYLRTGLPGFRSVACYRGGGGAAGVASGLQWVFSDGLASVSLFIEPFDRLRHGTEVSTAEGATHTVTRRIQDAWVTAVGEVPSETLLRFTQGLERRP